MKNKPKPIKSNKFCKRKKNDTENQRNYRTSKLIILQITMNQKHLHHRWTLLTPKNYPMWQLLPDKKKFKKLRDKI